MLNIRFIFSYLVSIILIPIAILGIFHSYLFNIENSHVSFYIILSSSFLATACFFLSWYYSNLLIRAKTISKLNSFGFTSTTLDCRKISSRSVSEKLQNLIDSLRSYEDYKFELFGFCIPFFLIFSTTCVMGVVINPKSISAYFLVCAISTFVIKFGNRIIEICDIRSFRNYYVPFIENLIHVSKGLQFYGCSSRIFEKFFDKGHSVLESTKKDLSKSLWKVFAYTAIVFMGFVLFYLLKEEYFSDAFFNISNIKGVFFCGIFFYTMGMVSYLRYIRINHIKDINISQYSLFKEDIEFEKSIDMDNLFIVFHGIYFQEPNLVSTHSALNNVSLSVLPGEMIALTGENKLGISYIFDLLLKFYVPQSGKIYISGIPLENISYKQIRSIVGIFDEMFCLIKGNIIDNLQLLTEDEEKILAVSEKIDLNEDLNMPVIDEDGTLVLSQELRLKIQIARIILQNPRIVLINTPAKFESPLTEQMFYDFVKSVSKRKTVFINTDNLKTIIYSDKILYLGKTQNIFGSHADISLNKNYQNYIKHLNDLI